jgi:excisionase family DNA binding protein
MTPMTALRILRIRLQVNVHRSTFYRWMANGTMPTVKLVNRYYIKPPALERFIDEADWTEP